MKKINLETAIAVICKLDNGFRACSKQISDKLNSYEDGALFSMADNELKDERLGLEVEARDLIFLHDKYKTFTKKDNESFHQYMGLYNKAIDAIDSWINYVDNVNAMENKNGK